MPDWMLYAAGAVSSLSCASFRLPSHARGTHPGVVRWIHMKPRNRKGAARRKIVSDRSRAFFGAVAEQASAELPQLQQKIEERIQEQPGQQQQSKSEPDEAK